MASSLVDRATSSLLIGPDWAMNTEICEMLNRDLGQAKDVVKAAKKRLRNKNPKVQLLALTLLETVIKNCGDIVHMHVAEKGILTVMVKIVKKKLDLHVKEKILLLIDTWQKAFGGPRGRYPQYYAAYQDLLHSGAVFPQRPERSALILTDEQTQPQHNHDNQQAPESFSMGSNLPILSLTEVQNARGLMDVLAEMLNALDPVNKEELKEEVIVDLVEQCRSYKRRVFHLVNTTLEEDLLSLCLALNDDLQRVLAKHDAIAAGIAVHQEKPKFSPALVDVDEADSNTWSTTEPNGRSSAGTTSQDPFKQLLLTGPQPSDEKNGSINPPAKVDPLVDLLSWEDDVPTTENPLALVPINRSPALSTSDQDTLVLFDTFSQNNTTASNSFDSFSSFPSKANTTTNGFQMLPLNLHSNGGVPTSGVSQYEQTHYMQEPQINHEDSVLNGHGTQGFSMQQQPPPPVGINVHDGVVLPPPPWETQLTQGNQLAISQAQQTQSILPGVYSQAMQIPHTGGIYSQTSQTSQTRADHPQTMQTSQPGGIYPQMKQTSQTGGVYPWMMQNLQLGGGYAQAMQGASSQMMQNLQTGGAYPQVMPATQTGGVYSQMMQSPMAGAIYPMMQNSQLPGPHSLHMQSGQMPGMHPFTTQGVQMAGMQLLPAMPGNMGGYAYAQQPGLNYYNQMKRAHQFETHSEISRRMYGLFMHENGGQMNMTSSTYQIPASSSLSLQQQPMKPTKPEDKLFGDLVSLSKQIKS